MFGTQRLGGFEPRCGSYVHHPYTSMKEVWDEVNSMAENGQVFCQYMIGNAYCYGDCIEMLGYDDAYYYLGDFITIEETCQKICQKQNDTMKRE